jgi:mRNA interferase HigB
MQILPAEAVLDYCRRYPEAQQQLLAWHADAAASHWSRPIEVKNRFSSVSILADNRLVFNIKGNRYRLVVKVNYELGIVMIKFFGSHVDYDRIDAESI